MEPFNVPVDSSCRAPAAVQAGIAGAMTQSRKPAAPCLGRFARPTRLPPSRSIQRAAGQVGELARHPFGNLARDRKLAVAFEMLDREPGIRIVDARGLELAVAEIAERALDRQHLARRLRRRTLRRR